MRRRNSKRGRHWCDPAGRELYPWDRRIASKERPPFCQPAPSTHATSSVPEALAVTGYFWLEPEGEIGSLALALSESMRVSQMRPRFSQAAWVRCVSGASQAELIGQVVPFQGWAKRGRKVSPLSCDPISRSSRWVPS